MSANRNHAETAFSPKVLMKRFKRIIWLGPTLLILVAGCSLPEIPESVSWDAETSVPISGKTYALWEIAEEDEVLIAEGSGIGMTLPDSMLFFKFHEDLEPISAAEHLKLDALSHQIEQPLYGLRIPVNSESTHNIPLSTLNPALANRHGTPAVVPSFPYEISLTLPLTEAFTEACTDSGQVDISITSHLNFALNSMDVDWMTDRGDPVRLYEGGVDADLTVNGSRSLSGWCLNDEMELEISGAAVGGESIIVDSARGIDITLSIGEITTYYYIGQLPRQVMVRDSVYELDQQHDIYEGEVKTGTLTITASSHSLTADSVRVTLLDVYNPDGSPVVTGHYIPAGMTEQIEYDLAAHVIRLDDPAQQTIRARLQTVMLPTEETVTFEAGTQWVEANFSTNDLTFSYFDGCLHDLNADIEEDVTEVEQPPDGWESLRLDRVDATLITEGGMPLDCDLEFRVQSENDDGILGEVERSANIYLGRDTTIVFNWLEELTPVLPTRFAHSGQVVLNGRTTLYDTSKVRGSLEISSPLAFSLDETTVPGEAEEIDIDPVEDLQELIVSVKVWNSLPLSGRLTMFADWDSSSVAESSGIPIDTIFSTRLPHAILENGRVTEPGYGELQFHAPDRLYELLRDPPFYVRTELTTEGTDGQTVTAHGTDYIRFKAVAMIRYRISTDDE